MQSQPISGMLVAIICKNLEQPLTLSCLQFLHKEKKWHGNCAKILPGQLASLSELLEITSDLGQA